GTYLVGLTLSSTLPGLPSLVPDVPVMVDVAPEPLAPAVGRNIGEVRPDTLNLVTPPVVQGETYQNAVLATFPNPQNLAPSAFVVIVQWGDGTRNHAGDGVVTLVPNPLGGFDVIGSHTYAAAVVGAIYSVQVLDPSSGALIASTPVLFHFFSLNPY